MLNCNDTNDTKSMLFNFLYAGNSEKIVTLMKNTPLIK